MSGVNLYAEIQYSKIAKNKKGVCEMNNYKVLAMKDELLQYVKSIIYKAPKRYKSTALQALNQSINTIGVNAVTRNIALNIDTVNYLLWDIATAKDFHAVNNYVISELTRFISIVQGCTLTATECYEISNQIKS